MSNANNAGGQDSFNGTSDTSFGRSVESQAQIADAVTSEQPGEILNVYRLVPTAGPSDPNWGNAPNHGEIVVAARTTGDARIVAADRELDFMDVDAAPAGDVTTKNASAFRNDRLYTVIEIERDQRGLTRGVLSGEIRVDTIKPTQI